MKARLSAITQERVAALLKPRPGDSHKGLFGTVVVIGGASGMAGAALLAGRAALRLGAGCVHVGFLAENAPAVDMAQPELMLHRAQEALRLLPPPGHGANGVLAIGCGLGREPIAQKIVLDVLQKGALLVLDADALNLIAAHAKLRELLRAREAPSLVTPHPGEAARLLGISPAEVQADRAHAAWRLSKELRCGVVLKGAGTVCATRDGKLFLNQTGNPGMSAPGMGDVLTGMIAALMAQGLYPDEAMLLAVHLHGAAGDALAGEGLRMGMTASEVTEQARWLLNQWASHL